MASIGDYIYNYTSNTTATTPTINWGNVVPGQMVTVPAGGNIMWTSTWPPEKREPGEYDEMELAAAHAKIDQLTEELKALILRVQDLESRG